MSTGVRMEVDIALASLQGLVCHTSPEYAERSRAGRRSEPGKVNTDHKNMLRKYTRVETVEQPSARDLIRPNCSYASHSVRRGG
jgi:hypothetical protein